MPFTDSTSVLTPSGYVPIRSLVVGDELATPLGKTRVTVCGRCKRAPGVAIIKLTDCVEVVDSQVFYTRVTPPATGPWWGELFDLQDYQVKSKLGILQGRDLNKAAPITTQDIVTLPGLETWNWLKAEVQRELFASTDTWFLGTENRIAVVGPTLALTDFERTDAPEDDWPHVGQPTSMDFPPPAMATADVVLFARWVERNLRADPNFFHGVEPQ